MATQQASLWLATVNLQGYSTAEPDLLHMMSNGFLPQVICVQEHLFRSDTNFPSVPGYDFLGTFVDVPAGSKGVRGLGYFVEKTLSPYTTLLNSSQPLYLLWLSIKVGTCLLLIGNVHQTHSTDLETQQQVIDAFTQDTLNLKYDTLILAGDFNAQLGNSFNGTGGSCNPAGRQLAAYCRATSMLPVNASGKFACPYTRFGRFGTSVLDYILTDLPCSKFKTFFIFSDHLLLSAHLTLPSHQSSSSLQNRPRYKFCRKPEVLAIYQAAIQTLSNTFDQLCSIDSMWEAIRNKLHDAAQHSFVRPATKSRGLSWWTTELTKLKKLRSQTLSLLFSCLQVSPRSEETQIAYAQHLQARKEFKQAVYSSKLASSLEFSMVFSGWMNNKPKGFWSILRSRRTRRQRLPNINSGTLLTDTAEANLNAFKQGFETLAQTTDCRLENQLLQQNTDSNQLPEPTLEESFLWVDLLNDLHQNIRPPHVSDIPAISNCPPTLLEVNMAVTKLPNTAGGIDNIMAEQLKLGGPALVLLLHSLVGKCWHESKVPKQWLQGMVFPIYKKKGNSYRICQLSWYYFTVHCIQGSGLYHN